MNRRNFLKLLITTPLCATVLSNCVSAQRPNIGSRQLIASMSFKDWLKIQKPNIQNNILGPDRANRFRLNPEAKEFMFPTYSWATHFR